MSQSASGNRAVRFLFPLAASVLPLFVYSLTVCRDIYWWDTIEFMLCGRFLCPPHPPGYPLLTLLLRAVALVPLPNMPLRMNLVSTLAAAGSCLFVFLIVRRLTKDRFAGLFAALAWGFSYELWSQATVLEAYALNVLLISIAVYAALVSSEEGRPESALLGVFVLGLGLANHLTSVFWLPGLLIIIGTRSRLPAGRRFILGCIGFFALGPFLYLCLLVFSKSDVLVSYGGISNLKTLCEFVSGRPFQHLVGSGASGYVGRQLVSLPAQIGKQFLVSSVFIIPGVAWCIKRNRRFGLAVLTGFVLSTGFAVVYNISDKEGFFLPAYLACVLVIGAGFGFLRQEWARAGRGGGRTSIGRKTAVTLVGFAMLALPLAVFYPRLDRHGLHGLRDLSDSLLAELPAESVLFTDDYSAVRGIRWLSAERGERPVLAIAEYLLCFPWYLRALDEHLPVPDKALDIGERLWHSRVKGAAFDRLLGDGTQEIKRLLVEACTGRRQVFWMPTDADTWIRSWKGFGLKPHGLTYRYGAAGDTTLDTFELTFPGPERYGADRTADATTRNLCYRFAAVANRRGTIRGSLGDHTGAVSDFDLALAYAPDYTNAIANKGITFYYSGQADSASYYLHKCLELEPDYAGRGKIRAFLSKLGQ